MQIALLGYGKMGKTVERLALDQGDFITSSTNADICIDFSHASVVVEHVKLCAKMGKNLVIGTTGWESREQEVRDIIEASKIGIIYAPNFSLGVYLFLKMVEHGSKLMQDFPEYDVAAIEWHHKQKKDAPSGTGLEILKRLQQQAHMTSLRVGSIPGTHLVLFDSPCDTISLQHEARNREGFAKGALTAARWLIGKQGFFTLEDMFERTIHAT